MYFTKTLILSIIYSKCGSKNEKMFKEVESIEILNILSLIDNMEQHQKIWQNLN